MKTLAKLICIILSVCCIASSFVACDKKEEGTTQGTEIVATETEAPKDIHPTIAQKDYADDCFMHIFEGRSRLWTEESKNDVFSQALFDRQVKLQDYLGVNLIGIQTGNLHEYGDAFTNAVKNKDGSVDVLVASAYVNVADFIVNGYLRDYNDFNQIDLSADYWKTDYMSEIQVDDRIFLGYSEFNIFNTYVFTFNKTMLAQYSDAIDESLYESVRNYRWTLDKMISLANLVYIDKTSDGKTEDDTFGISGHQWIPFIGFLHACDIPLVDQDETGKYRVSVYNSTYQAKSADLINKLHELSKSDCAWFKFRIEDTPLVTLQTGRTLLYVQNTGSIVDLLNYEVEFGVLPFPMYDEAQKEVGYRSFNYDGYITFPSYMRNEDLSVETVEYLSFISDPVQTAYYEKQLGKQVADTPDDSEMLRLIWDGICTDFGVAYQAIDSWNLDTNLYMLPNLTHANTTSNIASYVKSYESAANKAIDKWMKMYTKKWG